MRAVLRAVVPWVCVVAVLVLPSGLPAQAGSGAAPVRAELGAELQVRADARWVRLLTTTFHAAAGERHRVSATAVGTVRDAVPDTVLVLHAQLHCGVAGRTEQPATLQYVNIWRGRTDALVPYFTYAARVTGRHRCSLLVRSGRPRPRGALAGNQVTLLPRSSLLVSDVHAQTVEFFRPHARSALVGRGSTSWRKVSQVGWTSRATPGDGGARRVVAVRGWVSLTACTSASGSHDPVANRQLCTAPHRSPNGSVVHLRLQVDHFDSRGRHCATSYVNGRAGRYVRVSREVHHSSRSYAAEVALRPGCRSRLRISAALRWRSGASMMVHAQGTLLTAAPRSPQGCCT